MANEFFALMSRMRHITRWGLMRNTFSESHLELKCLTSTDANTKRCCRPNTYSLMAKLSGI